MISSLQVIYILNKSSFAEVFKLNHKIWSHQGSNTVEVLSIHITIIIARFSIAQMLHETKKQIKSLHLNMCSRET